MKNLKVCHIITMLELGGAQRNTLFTVEHLDKARFTPLLIAGPGGILDNEAKEIPGVKKYFVPELVRPISPVNDLLAVFKIYNILVSEKPDIVHTHSSKAGILGRIAAWLARVPVIIHTYHGFGFNDFQNILTRSIYVLAEKMASLMTTRFIAVTKEDIAKGIKYGIGTSGKYSLIRSGIDTLKYSSLNYDKAKLKAELGIAQDENVITTIGPFKPQKNIVDFIKTGALVLKKFPKTCLLVVGDGEQRQLIERLIRELNISNMVKLLGWRNNINEILSFTDIFVMTSLWEGLPRSILEAMCSGVPVVANAVDGVKEIVKEGETGFLIAPKNTDLMAEKIIYLLSNKDIMKSFGNNAIGKIDNQYDIRLMVKQQEELYLTLKL